MKLLAVSGGPDSMVMLYKNRNKKIVVAHVNYNARTDSMNDQKIVENFCKKYSIPFEILTLNEKPKENFQKWARDVRYKFFEKIYKKYECNQLLVAHHIDDFLETAIMQQESGREPKYFGIQKKVNFNGMKIVRPYINKYWKKDMLDICNIYNIPYAIDSSNSKPIYTRNKTRIKLSELTLEDKKKRVSWFKMANRILIKKNAKVNSYYKFWKKTNFSTKSFKNLRYQREIIFEFLHEYGEDIKISKSKLESIISFINSNNGKSKYKISDNQFISKENKRIFITIIDEQ